MVSATGVKDGGVLTFRRRKSYRAGENNAAAFERDTLFFVVGTADARPRFREKVSV
jgi:hypothetical protein